MPKIRQSRKPRKVTGVSRSQRASIFKNARLRQSSAAVRVRRHAPGRPYEMAKIFRPVKVTSHKRIPKRRRR